jgi:hypothetical protein
MVGTRTRLKSMTTEVGVKEEVQADSEDDIDASCTCKPDKIQTRPKKLIKVAWACNYLLAISSLAQISATHNY